MDAKIHKDLLKKFDQFLSMFDVEELIRKGIDYVKFRYNKHGVDVSVYMTPDDLREAKKNVKA